MLAFVRRVSVIRQDAGLTWSSKCRHQSFGAKHNDVRTGSDETSLLLMTILRVISTVSLSQTERPSEGGEKSPRTVGEGGSWQRRHTDKPCCRSLKPGHGCRLNVTVPIRLDSVHVRWYGCGCFLLTHLSPADLRRILEPSLIDVVALLKKRRVCLLVGS